MNPLKAIAYCYPTSPRSKELGKPDGCYFVEQRWYHPTKPCYDTPIAVSEGYQSPLSPDLIADYKKTEGTPDPSFLQFASDDVLEAIGE